jgi:hypothetical protein
MNIIGNLKVRFITWTDNVIGKLYTFLGYVKKTIVHYIYLDEYFKYYECEYNDDVLDRENEEQEDENEQLDENEQQEDENEQQEDENEQQEDENEDDE